MKWKEFLREYLAFTRKERIGIGVLILLIVGIWIFPKVSRPSRAIIIQADTAWITAANKLMVLIDSGDQQNFNSHDNFPYSEGLRPRSNEELSAQPFYFDPNTLAPAGWKKLGIRQKVIATIQNYLQKGGHFSKPEDLKRIYGIRQEEYSRLEPYIKIAATVQAEWPTGKTGFKEESFSNRPKNEAIDVNAADTSALVALPGIGSKLASRIISFRDKLGGFYSIEQIGETYGLADSVFTKLKPFLKLETAVIRKFNINSATKDELKSHPYLKWTLANAIVEYRNQHGNFSSLEDLKKITLITDEVFEKLKFYLTL